MVTVGKIRQKCAFEDSDTPVILVADRDDPKTARLLEDLEIVAVYPDTTDANGDWNSTFKISVRRKV